MTEVRLPDGYHSLNPYIVADDVEHLIEFLVRVFRAEERDQPWGDRVGGFVDPANNRWWVATHRPKM